MTSAALTCPNGLQKKAGGTVLLVHGTGSTGAETWANGPYMELLPSAGPGYDVCYVNLPERALGDAQTSAEYVSYLTVALSSESATGKVSLISHSQGGLNVQWSLDFWPANRQLVKAFFAIAPDFHAVLQQTVGSHFLDAINSQGGVALVGTTVAYTKEDDIIQPEILPVTSRLSGASVFAVQDLCGPLYIADHFTMTVSSAAYYLGLDALENGGTASSSHFNQASLNNFNRLPAILSQAFHDALAVITYPKVKSEPLLRQYVCERGNAASYCASTNYPTDINGIQPS
ncbi:SPOSA6832_02643 [Sporobolomyces salmonicolor]|uniref:SPOSA6832_02643-mRNA-1:cds n=1 Tax=Sporidiobolus salmonicolor TaxID=5005 RepID=A0A0D6EM07_SPOSA|nr:SPOSA6832_02643 [Sporobolomyces salmonicolor]